MHPTTGYPLTLNPNPTLTLTLTLTPPIYIVPARWSKTDFRSALSLCGVSVCYEEWKKLNIHRSCIGTLEERAQNRTRLTYNNGEIIQVCARVLVIYILFW